MLGSLFTKSCPGLFPNMHTLQVRASYSHLYNLTQRRPIQNGDAAWALHDNRWYRVRITNAYAPTKRGETTKYSVWHWKFNKDFGSLSTESGAIAPDNADTRLWLREFVGQDGVIKTDWPAMVN